MNGLKHLHSLIAKEFRCPKCNEKGMITIADVDGQKKFIIMCKLQHPYEYQFSIKPLEEKKQVA